MFGRFGVEGQLGAGKFRNFQLQLTYAFINVEVVTGAAETKQACRIGELARNRAKGQNIKCVTNRGAKAVDQGYIQGAIESKQPGNVELIVFCADCCPTNFNLQSPTCAYC